MPAWMAFGVTDTSRLDNECAKPIIGINAIHSKAAHHKTWRVAALSLGFRRVTTHIAIDTSTPTPTLSRNARRSALAYGVTASRPLIALVSSSYSKSAFATASAQLPQSVPRPGSSASVRAENH